MVHLTKRDQEIIQFLRDQGWALSQQIAERFFSSRNACSNRMRVLVKAGLIEEVPLTEFRKRFFSKEVLLNIVCGLSGKSKVYRLGGEIRASMAKKWARTSSTNMVAHQILLNRVIEVFEETFGDLRVNSEVTNQTAAYLRGENTKGVHPDLVTKVGDILLAVEVERSPWRGLKNSSYEDRFQTLSLNYDRILYVLENENYLVPLAKKARGLSKVGFCSIFKMNEVFRPEARTVSLFEFVGGR